MASETVSDCRAKPGRRARRTRPAQIAAEKQQPRQGVGRAVPGDGGGTWPPGPPGSAGAAARAEAHRQPHGEHEPENSGFAAYPGDRSVRGRSRARRFSEGRCRAGPERFGYVPRVLNPADAGEGGRRPGQGLRGRSRRACAAVTRGRRCWRAALPARSIRRRVGVWPARWRLPPRRNAPPRDHVSGDQYDAARAIPTTRRDSARKDGGQKEDCPRLPARRWSGRAGVRRPASANEAAGEIGAEQALIAENGVHGLIVVGVGREPAVEGAKRTGAAPGRRRVWLRRRWRRGAPARPGDCGKVARPARRRAGGR